MYYNRIIHYLKSNLPAFDKSKGVPKTVSRAHQYLDSSLQFVRGLRALDVAEFENASSLRSEMRVRVGGNRPVPCTLDAVLKLVTPWLDVAKVGTQLSREAGVMFAVPLRRIPRARVIGQVNIVHSMLHALTHKLSKDSRKQIGTMRESLCILLANCVGLSKGHWLRKLSDNCRGGVMKVTMEVCTEKLSEDSEVYSWYRLTPEQQDEVQQDSLLDELRDDPAVRHLVFEDSFDDASPAEKTPGPASRRKSGEHGAVATAPATTKSQDSLPRKNGGASALDMNEVLVKHKKLVRCIRKEALWTAGPKSAAVKEWYGLIGRNGVVLARQVKTEVEAIARVFAKHPSLYEDADATGASGKWRQVLTVASGRRVGTVQSERHAVPKSVSNDDVREFTQRAKWFSKRITVNSTERMKFENRDALPLVWFVKLRDGHKQVGGVRSHTKREAAVLALEYLDSRQMRWEDAVILQDRGDDGAEAEAGSTAAPGGSSRDCVTPGAASLRGRKQKDAVKPPGKQPRMSPHTSSAPTPTWKSSEKP